MPFPFGSGQPCFLSEQFIRDREVRHCTTLALPWATLQKVNTALLRFLRARGQHAFDSPADIIVCIWNQPLVVDNNEPSMLQLLDIPEITCAAMLFEPYYKDVVRPALDYATAVPF